MDVKFGCKGTACNLFFQTLIWFRLQARALNLAQPVCSICRNQNLLRFAHRTDYSSMNKKASLIPLFFLVALGLSTLLWHLKFNTAAVKEELFENKLGKALADFQSKYKPIANLNYVGEAATVRYKDIYFLTAHLLAPKTLLLREKYETPVVDTTLFIFQQEADLLAHTEAYTIFWRYKDDLFHYASGISK